MGKQYIAFSGQGHRNIANLKTGERDQQSLSCTFSFPEEWWGLEPSLYVCFVPPPFSYLGTGISFIRTSC